MQSRDDNELKKTSQLLRRGMWISPLLFPVYILFLVLPVLVLGKITWQLARYESVPSNSVPAEQPKPALPSTTVTQDETTSSRNPFAQLSYPLDECGDSQPADLSSYPVNVYPVFVTYSDRYLDLMKSLCRDSLLKVREGSGKQSIQVASFLTYEKADLFKEFVDEKFLDTEEFLDAEVGKPSVFDIPFNSSDPVLVNSKGDVQFSVNDNKALIEVDLRSFSLDRYTFSAVAGQNAVVAVRSDSDKVSLSITAPNGEFFSVIKDPQDSRVTSWTGKLPMEGTYTVDVINQADQSFYRLFLQIDP